MSISAQTWTVEIFLSDEDDHTHAEARLHSKDQTHLEGRGHARRNPSDRDVPEIGEEIAAARALSDLAHELLLAAADDIEAVTHHPATLEA